MNKKTILELGKQLAVRRLKGVLHDQLRIDRPTLAYDTVYRAFARPDEDTETLKWIRDEALKMLRGRGVEIAAPEDEEAVKAA